MSETIDERRSSLFPDHNDQRADVSPGLSALLVFDEGRTKSESGGMMLRLVVCVVNLMILGLAAPVVATNLLNEPESVDYDTLRQCYYVSNVGDGNIVRVDANGGQSYFNTDLDFTAGIHIVGDTLYACSSSGPNAGLIGFDLATGEMIMNLALPDMALLNDVTSDTSGYLYVTDYYRDLIFRVEISTQNNTVLVNSEDLSMPNGILFDARDNRLLVIDQIGGGNDVIIAVSLPGGAVTTVASLGVSSCDGITEDNDGNVYFSSWQTNRVYKYDHDFAGPYEVFSQGHSGPADIFYNKTLCEMAVPSLNADRLDLVLDSLADCDGDGILSATDNCPWQFNPGQGDADADSLGDACDDCTDLDGDGYGDPGFPANSCLIDNCPGEYNPGQDDADGDGIGDVCDCSCPMQGDIDGDEFITALDLASEIDILFAGGTDPQDPDCPTTRGDFDCDGFSTALDLGDLIDHLFAGGDGPCDPCPL